MSINSTMYVGLSGMKANEHAMGVVGNNLANMNTIGFKASRATFADMLSQTLLGVAGPYQVGQGVGIVGTQRLNTQGAFLTTGVTSDLAIGGNGFFIVRDTSGGQSQQLYTRAGQFQLDADGYLTTLQGLRLQGYGVDANGTLSTRLGDLKIGDTTAPPKATGTIQLHLNLDAATAVAQGNFDPAAPQATASYSTTVTVYDSKGNAHQVDVYFVKTDQGKWEWHALASGDDIQGGTAGQATEIASGTLEFNEDGLLQSVTSNGGDVQFAGAAPQTLSFDFGSAIADGGDGSGTSGFGAPSAVNFLDQDGYAAGQLQTIDIDPDGTIRGTYSNGQVLTLGQVALANFTNPTDLDARGNNLFAATPDSGAPLVGAPGTGGLGTVHSGMLEQSNVDLTNEFATMIVAQRGYQAASRTIVTADQLLAETVNLKR